MDLKKFLGQLLNPSKKKCWKIGTVELPIMFFGCFSWPKTLGPERSNIMDFIGFHWPPACRKKNTRFLFWTLPGVKDMIQLNVSLKMKEKNG